MCRCAVCAVSDAECLLGRVPHISHVIPLWVFQLLKSERWNSGVFGVLQSPVARELRAELVDGGGAFATVVLVDVGGAPDP